MAELQKSPHKGIKTFISSRQYQRVAAMICGIPVIVGLLSGCRSNKNVSPQETGETTETITDEFEQKNTVPTVGNYNLEIIDPNKEIVIPYDAVISSTNKKTGKVEFIGQNDIKTIGDLECVETLNMYYHGEDEDLLWLRYCENLTDLHVTFYGEYPETKIQIRNIANIPNLERLTLFYPDELSFNNYSFLLDLEIRELKINFSDSKICSVDEELLNELKKKYNLTLSGESYELITSNKDANTIDGNDLEKIDWNVEIKISPNTISNYYNISTDGKVYARNLINIEELQINYDGNEDLSWLRYCINLKNLSIRYNDDNNLKINTLSAITKIPNLESLHLIGITNLKKQDYDFLNDISTLNCLTISFSENVPVNADFSGIENLINIGDLTLNYNSANVNIDFLKIANLKNLTFDDSPYTVVLELDSKMYESLIEKGCNIKFKNEADLFKFIEANKQLDEIVSSFNLNENASDVEKLDAMLCWILENFRYSVEIAAIDRTVGISKEEAEEKNREMVPKFYESGLLTAYFEGDGTVICGNYASMLEALAHRLDFTSSYVESEKHAYNLVVFEGEYYYVDATWLDPVMLNDEYYDAGNADIIRAGNGMDLAWYLCSPQDVAVHDNGDFHQTTKNIPSDFNFNAIKTDKEEKEYDVTNKLIEMVVNGKKYIVPAAIAIAIFIAFGVAIKAKKKRKKEKVNYAADWNYDNGYGRGHGR